MQSTVIIKPYLFSKDKKHTKSWCCHTFCQSLDGYKLHNGQFGNIWGYLLSSLEFILCHAKIHVQHLVIIFFIIEKRETVQMATNKELML